ncbi:MAG TPA: stage III sporulation protein AG [Epulopiscium sp.]|nr:stage III sporulation protein AG [Candidatus Epulonipiscium sp.]
MKILGKLLPEDKRDKKTIYKILGLLVLGMMLLIVSSQLKTPDQGVANNTLEPRTSVAVASSSLEAKDSESYEVEMEKRLKAILKKMQGVGEVEVMITITYGKEIILAQDVTSQTATTVEEDTDGGTRQVSNYEDQAKIVMQNLNVASGNEPVVIKEKQPEIQGVLVIAQGAGNSEVKQSIAESAQILLGIPAHRVTVHQLQTLKK